MPIGRFKYLRSEIIWSSAYSLFPLSRVKYLGSKSEISYFQLHVFCEKKVSEFKISVNYIFSMAIYACEDKLVYIVTSFYFV